MGNKLLSGRIQGFDRFYPTRSAPTPVNSIAMLAFDRLGISFGTYIFASPPFRYHP